MVLVKSDSNIDRGILEDFEDYRAGKLETVDLNELKELLGLTCYTVLRRSGSRQWGDCLVRQSWSSGPNTSIECVAFR